MSIEDLFESVFGNFKYNPDAEPVAYYFENGVSHVLWSDERISAQKHEQINIGGATMIKATPINHSRLTKEFMLEHGNTEIYKK